MGGQYRHTERLTDALQGPQDCVCWRPTDQGSGSRRNHLQSVDAISGCESVSRARAGDCEKRRERETVQEPTDRTQHLPNELLRVRQACNDRSVQGANGSTVHVTES
jgi:hypothetical protein